MAITKKIVPFVLSGTLVFGGMIVPAQASAEDVSGDAAWIDRGRQLYQQHSAEGEAAWASVKADLVAAGLTDAEAESLLLAVQNAVAADLALEQAATEQAAAEQQAAAAQQQQAFAEPQTWTYDWTGNSGAASSSGESASVDAVVVEGVAEGQEVEVPAPEMEGIATEVPGNVYQTQLPGQGFQIVRYSQNLSTEMFIASIGEQARQIGQENGLYASVMIAQAILESGSGSSTLSQAPNNNLFGIKGNYQGLSVNMATNEDDGTGSLYGIQADFRRYPTQKESLYDYASLLRNDPWNYAAAWKENAASPEIAAQALEGTYATSTLYAESLAGLIETYNLKRFDQPLPFELAGQVLQDGKIRDLNMGDFANLQALATAQIGIPYTWGGNTPEEGFDCSGLVCYLYRNALGIELPRTTYEQQYVGAEVAFDQLQMGDLLFFADGGSTEHVAMYLGDGFYIHAPEPGDAVKIASMESYMPSFAKRVYATQPAGTSAAKLGAGDKKQQFMPVVQKSLAEIIAEHEAREQEKAQNQGSQSLRIR